jgi:GTP cyclohydrolase II
MLGLGPDLRDYSLVKPMLQQLGIHSLRLMTNNPEKTAALRRHDIHIAQRMPIAVPANPFNQRYLETKATKMGHMLP